jgi:ribosomal protein S18 acetylase RimI-like enzyme
MIIQRGFDEYQREQVALIYCHAFERKLTPLVGAADQAAPLIASDLNASCCFVAVDPSEAVLGVAGFQHAGQRLLNFRVQPLMAKYGWFSGLLHYMLAVIFERPADKQFLQMDGIAVSENARGSGVGTQLIDALVTFAGAHGYQGVRLDVVDTNPNARRLYERLGFVAQHSARYPFLRSAGFESVTTMIKRV